MLRLTLSGGFSAAGADGTDLAIKSKKARALLAYLALSPRKSRSREEIMALLWSDRGEEQARASLRQVLTGLRKDLEEKAVGALMVSNEAVALNPERVTIEVGGEDLLAGFHLHDPAFEDWLRDERLRHEDATISAPQAPGLPLPDKPSIAVLPFVNMSGDPEQDYFADGITEDIITELSRFRSLFVIARNSSFHYKGQSPKIPDVGRELGVQYVVEGSVRKAGTKVRVTAQLIDGVNGGHLWAERYDRDLTDIFAVQDEITQMVASNLAGGVEEATLERARQKSTESLAAHDYVLRGDRAYSEYTEEGATRARLAYLKAIELDPNYARAYAGRALTYVSSWGYLWGEDPDGDLDRAFEYAQKAVALDDAENRAHYVLGIVQTFRGHYARGRASLDRAVALNPNDAYVLAELPYSLQLLGDCDAGIAMGEKALRLNPHSPAWCLIFLAEAYFTARRYEDAIATFERATDELPDTSVFLAASYAQFGRIDDARAVMASYLELADPVPWWSNVPASTPLIENDRTGLLRYMVYMYPYKNPSDLDHLLDGLRKAGLSD